MLIAKSKKMFITYIILASPDELEYIFKTNYMQIGLYFWSNLRV